MSEEANEMAEEARRTFVRDTLELTIDSLKHSVVAMVAFLLAPALVIGMLWYIRARFDKLGSAILVNQARIMDTERSQNLVMENMDAALEKLDMVRLTEASSVSALHKHSNDMDSRLTKLEDEERDMQKTLESLRRAVDGLRESMDSKAGKR